MKRVIITGTSRGIGLELVKIFAAKGHKVLAISRNIEPVRQLHLENVELISCDISDAVSVKTISEFLNRKWNSVDILINNAGAIVNKPFLETTVEDFQKVYETNVFGVVNMVKAVLPYMEKTGHIVTISSMGGVQGSMKFPGLSAYSSSKGAVITLSELLAEEYKNTGPSFNVLALGAVQTEMLEEAFPGYKAPLQPAEMADYIYNFCITANKYYNGKLLQVSNSTP